jgi:hypothetical protein
MSKRKTNSKKPKGGGGGHISTTTDTTSKGSSVGGPPHTHTVAASATAQRAPPQLLALDPVVLDRADATVGVEVIIHSCLATHEKNNGLPGTITKSYNEASGLVGVEVGARGGGAGTRPTMSFKLHNLVKHPSRPASWEEFDALTPPPFYGDKSMLAPEYHNSCALTNYIPMLELMYGKDNMDADDVWVEVEQDSGSLKFGSEGCRIFPAAVMGCDLPLMKALGRRNTDFNQNIVVKKAGALNEMPNTAPLLAMLQSWAGYQTLPDSPDAKTPFCAGRRRIETLDFMLSAGADPNVCDSRGQSLLHFAVAIENLDPNDVDNRAVLPLLLRHKADHTRKDGQGTRPVDGYLHTVSALFV